MKNQYYTNYINLLKEVDFMKLFKNSFDGKQLFCGYLSGYNIYVNHELVERLSKDNLQKEMFEIELPIKNCDVVEIGTNILVLVPGNKILYHLDQDYYDIVKIDGGDCKAYSKSSYSTLILAPGKVKVYCQSVEEDENNEDEEVRSMVILLYPDGRTEHIPDEKILEYV